MGCRSQSFFEQYALDANSLGVELHKSTDFPRSLPIKRSERELLTAGKKEGFSCFAEYYLLDESTDPTTFLPREKGWKKHSEGLYIKERDFFLDGVPQFETEIFFTTGKNLLYAHFLGKEPQNLKELFPALYQ